MTNKQITDEQTIDEWRGLYRNGWQGEIVPEAFSHPAKFSRALIRHIYDHALAWLAPGDSVLDPFGGVGLGGLDAMRHGLHYVGIELEEKFVTLGNANIALWNKRYSGSFRKWGTAQLLQGDSCQLREVVAGSIEAVISSPPYGNSEVAKSTGAGLHDIQGNREHRIIVRLADDWSGYSKSLSNLGNLSDDTFWSAALTIVRECHAILRPGGHAVWVVKDFVRSGQVVNFTGNWRQLCESVGFITLHEHHALLTENWGMQYGLDGNHKRLITRHKSFFRHLAEKKGSPYIDWESVVCMVKEEP